MKFVYHYRTSDNTLHTGVINAADRDAAFLLLKRKGIRPSRVEEAPGFFNRLFGKGKRWIAIILLAVASLVAAVAFWRSRSIYEELESSYAEFGSSARRQIIGDSAVVELGLRTGWATVFPEKGERFLASFAVPGTVVAIRNVPEKELQLALGRSLPPEQSDGIEERQIKAIVEGMKHEIRSLVSDGWTLKEVGSALARRQDIEIGYYNRAKTELESAIKSGTSEEALIELWSELNGKLRKMGIRLVSLPEE